MGDEPLDRSVMVRLPVDLYEQVKAAADANERTISQEIRHVLRLHVTGSYPSVEQLLGVYDLAVVTEDRADDEHAALIALAYWLEAQGVRPGSALVRHAEGTRESV